MFVCAAHMNFGKQGRPITQKCPWERITNYTYNGYTGKVVGIACVIMSASIAFKLVSFGTI